MLPNLTYWSFSVHLMCVNNEVKVLNAAIFLYHTFSKPPSLLCDTTAELKYLAFPSVCFFL